MARDLMPTFYTLRSIELYGIPTKLDGVQMTLNQARVFVGMINEVWDTDRQSLGEAVGLAEPAFRKSFELVEGEWRSRKTIKLAGGIEFRSKYDGRRVDRMGRERAGKREQKSPVAVLLESGRRNSKRDKQAIVEVVRNALKQLDAEDKLKVLRDLGYKVA